MGRELQHNDIFSQSTTTFAIDNEWKRYTTPVVPDDRFGGIYFLAQIASADSDQQEENVWIDDVQLEQGGLTAFTQVPVAAQLVSAARGNFLPFGQEPDFNLIVQSLPDAAGTVSLSVEDFFFKTIFEKTHSFTTDHTGHSTLILNELSSKISGDHLRGVFIVSAVFNIEGVGRPYKDYFRFSVMNFLDNTQKNKNLFNLTYCWQLQDGGPDMARFLERERAIGFGSFTYDFIKLANDLDYALDEERMQLTEEYGFTCVGRPVLKIHDGIGGEISEANGTYKMINIKTKTSPTSTELTDFANICTIKAANRPWNTIWWFIGESNPGCEPLESVPDAFAKFLIATCQGIKAGNPQAKVLIEGGPWNLDPQYGTAWVERYIQDTKRINPTVHFDGAAAHHYRNFPENPNLDSDIAAFLAMLDRNGCSNWPFYINEGGCYPPFDIPEVGISPYVWNSANPWYFGPLSYHYGRSERISATFSARNWLVALKYQDRVACMEDFMTPSRYVDIDFTPRPYDKIPNTLGRLLGNASFDRDIPFAPDCRGYLFTEDATGAPIAAIWGYKESVDRWQEDPPQYTFDFGSQDVTFIDLMENEVTFPQDCDGRTIIPLSPFPLFVKGLPGTGTQLCDAITHYENVHTGTPVEIMGATLHNGSLTFTTVGFWYITPSAIPAEWVETARYCYSSAPGGIFGAIQTGTYAIATNNTGERVQANRLYMVSADLGGWQNTTATVQVSATQNANGTGTKVLLAQVSRPGNAEVEGYAMFPVTGTPGSPTPPSLAGYYVQVQLMPAGFYDNIVVTSEPAVGAVCGDAGHPYPIGDLTHDCYVDEQDLEMFAGQWMAVGCAGPAWCEGADLDHAVNNVNLQDLAVLAANWMNCTNPSPPCCCNP